MNLTESANPDRTSSRSLIKVNLWKTLARSFCGLKTLKTNKKQKIFVFDIKDFYHGIGWKKMVCLMLQSGPYDGAEVCELVGTFLLDKISVKYDKNSIGSYHDNGLSVFKNSTWNNKKELTKNIQGLWFRNNGRIWLKNFGLSGRDTEP